MSLRQLVVGFQQRLFASELDEHGGLRGTCVRAARVLWLAARGFRDDFCLERAASITYATLISLFPLGVLFMTVAGSLGSVGAEAPAVRRIEGAPAPGSAAPGETGEDGAGRSPGEVGGPPEAEASSNAVLDYVKRRVIPAVAPKFQEPLEELLATIQETRVFETWPTGLINLIASSVLFFSALGLLITMERNFNRIWKTPRRRSLLQKATAFWVILTTSPFMIIASMWIGDFLVPKGGWIDELTEDFRILDLIYDLLLPICIGFLGFTLLLLFLPAARVRVRSAAVGGLVAAVLWEISKRAFNVYVGWSGRETNFFRYAFAIPLFLLWLYVTWLIVLWGCEVAYVHQFLLALSRDVRREREGRHRRVSLAYLGLYALGRVAHAFRQGSALPTADALALELGEDRDAGLDETLGHLVASGLLVEDASHPGAYAAGRDLREVRLREVVAGLEQREFPGEPGPGEPVPRPAGVPPEATRAVAQRVDALIARLRGASHRELDEMSLEDLIAPEGSDVPGVAAGRIPGAPGERA